MVASLDEPFLESNGNVRLASIIGASRPNQSRIIAPGMKEDMLSRDEVRNTLRNDVVKADKLDAAVQRSLSDEWNTASLRIVEGILESIFRKVVKLFDSIKHLNTTPRSESC